MKLDIFNAHKQGIRENMEANLIFAKATGRAIKPYMLTYTYETIRIGKDEEDVLGKLQDVVLRLGTIPDATIKMAGYTKQSGRYDIFTSVEFTAKIPSLREELLDYDVDKAMKDLVKKEIGMHSWKDVNCQVMAMFKEGKIEWDEVVKAHKEDCEL